MIFLALRGEVDLDPGRAAVVGEAWVPALEVAGQIVVQDRGADLEEELGARWRPAHLLLLAHPLFPN